MSFFKRKRDLLKVGEKAPDFELVTETGEEVRLSSFLGKSNIVLYFYPKDNTPGCLVESSAFRDSFSEFQKLDAEILGVSSDNRESHVAFKNQLKLPFHLLSDNKNKVRELYGVPDTFGVIPGRVTFVINKEGIIQHVFNSQFNPKSHVKQALEILKQTVSVVSLS